VNLNLNSSSSLWYYTNNSSTNRVDYSSHYYIRHDNIMTGMERVLPDFVCKGIENGIEYAYSFEPYFTPTLVLGE